MKFKLLYALLAFLFFSCCRETVKENKSTSDSSQEINHLQMKRQNTPAPGTADIVITVLDTSQIQNSGKVKIKVDEVKQYGSSFPPLPVGTELFVNFQQDGLEQLRKSELKKYNILLKHEMKFNDQSEWTLLEIINK